MTVIEFSTVFQYGKTTIPKIVREQLNLADGDGVEWSINERREIIVSKRILLKYDSKSRYERTG